jgi:Cu(I)/Ag(I) efflux system membrane fusion protein
MKDAMVAGNHDQVAEFASETAKIFKGLPAGKLGTGEQGWYGHAVEMLSAIAGNTEIEKQRMHFIKLNQALVPLGKGLKGLERTIYVQHCPMANNNQGALWLSVDKEIRNPYFGEAMPDCGSITDSIK